MASIPRRKCPAPRPVAGHCPAELQGDQKVCALHAACDPARICEALAHAGSVRAQPCRAWPIRGQARCARHADAPISSVVRVRESVEGHVPLDEAEVFFRTARRFVETAPADPIAKLLNVIAASIRTRLGPSRR